MVSKIIMLVFHIFLSLQFGPSIAQTNWIRVGYYWNLVDTIPVSEINSALFTHLICAFAGLDPVSYQLYLSPLDEKYISNFTHTLKQKNPSIDTILSIGGEKANSSTISLMVRNSSYRKSFIDSSVSLARLYGFRGLDFSWIYPDTVSDEINMGILFQEWRAAISSEARNSSTSELILTARVRYSPLTSSGNYPVDSMQQYLDWVHVIASEYSRPPWNNFSTAANAALYDPGSVLNTDYGIRAWIDGGLSANKLVLGLPYYGYAWTLVNLAHNVIGAPATGPAIKQDGFLTYKYIKNYIEQYDSAHIMYNETYVVNYCLIGKTWIGFDDVEAIRAKISYAKEKKLLGYYVWLVSYDRNWVLSQAAGASDLTKQSNDKEKKAVAAGDFKSNVPNLIEYSFPAIEAATDGFSTKNKLGQGGYGPVYKGILSNGQEIAVKKLAKASTQGFEEFKNEVTLTAKLQHVNLLRVLGFCIDGDEHILVYEYMPNKSLDSYLFDPIRLYVLDWEKRIQIIEGIIQGLLYLQEYSRLTIIHRDLKLSNILLDEDTKPKISDFGMARMFAKSDLEANTGRIVGTLGYVSPEYARKGLYSTKSDVYSFGVLLLQIISGKRISLLCGPNESLSLLDYAYELWKDGKCMEFMDKSLDDTYSSCKLVRCLQIALLCVQENPIDRPSMLEVFTMLKNESTDVMIPRKPAFSEQNLQNKTVRQWEGCSGSTSSINDVTVSDVVAR
ncbi:cysteine-rich receptor-like protein kinase 10 [Pistacia vera]|uniref:cysteine-rich receptor-like protein kinase 10 n=1 Tax=Pistacia vera TaxID=55513 RepID=UPI0012639EE5|nr:cysteine-rich receptor-like protein kinase 10 [Pistacia vera]